MREEAWCRKPDPDDLREKKLEKRGGAEGPAWKLVGAGDGRLHEADLVPLHGDALGC